MLIQKKSTLRGEKQNNEIINDTSIRKLNAQKNKIPFQVKK